MKYLKRFEAKTHDESLYWLIPTDDRFRESLKEIKCSSNYMNILNGDSCKARKYKYVFIGYSIVDNIEPWGWNSYSDEMVDRYFEKNGYKFMGTVNILDGEIELSEVVNKYNL
jgi:hypothetical protein